MQRDKILVLGSEGFIGNHLVNYFLELNYQVTGCDLYEAPRNFNYTYKKVSRLSPEWGNVFSENIPGICINAAGSGNVPYSVTHPFSDFESNALDTIKVLDTIRRNCPACRYVHISSAAVYGNPQKLPVDERNSLNPLSPYGWHKLIAENICKEYSQLFNIPIAVVRPFSVYGNGLQKQLLWDICTKLSKADKIELFGTGNESRDFIHISDLVKLIGLIIKGGHFGNQVFNAASGTETTIREIAGIFQHCYDEKKQVHFSGEVRIGDPLNWKASINKAKEIGYNPSVQLQQGIKEYISWFKTV